MTTYADMVTLCLTFFVLLYSFSTLDTMKWKTVVDSLQGALGVMEGGGSGVMDGGGGDGVLEGITPDDTKDEKNEEILKNEIINTLNMENYLKYQEEVKKLEEIQTRLKEYLDDKEIGKSITASIEERGLVMRFQDSVLFEKGKADLVTTSGDILGRISNILKEINNPIRIEGHTDNLPIRTVRFPSNWELSTTRATNVLRFLIDEGLPGERLSAVGYGEFRPIAENDNEDNRRKNRRVDIVIIRESMMAQEPQ